jgi:hypothetical protein
LIAAPAWARACALGLATLLWLGAPASARAQGDPPPSAGGGPPVTAQAAQAVAPSGACDIGWVSRVYRDAKRSVARIERPDGGGGTGFVFHDRRHLATAFHVVDLGRSLMVQFPEGRTTKAEVVAVDEALDLAILELDEEADAAPLEPHEDIEVGTPVMAIGNPYGNLTRSVKQLEGLLNYSVTQGTVSAKSARYLQTDALLSPGNSGGPILTCDGRIVAVVDFGIHARIGVGVGVTHLVKLTKEIGRRGAYRGQIALKDFSLGLVDDIDAHAWVGPSMAGSLVVYDRFAFTLRGNFLWGSTQQTKEPIVNQSSRRFTLDLALSYRVLLFPYSLTPTYLIFSAGGSVKWEWRDETRFRVGYDNPGCPGQPGCDPKLVSDSRTATHRLLSPLFGAALRMSGFEVGYQFIPDPRDIPDTATHRILVGFVF